MIRVAMREKKQAKNKRAAKIALLLAVFLLLSPLSACGKSAAGVVLAGSTSVQPYAEVLAEEFALLHPGSEIDVQGGGSAAGITAAESGAADIGMSSRSLKEEEKWLWSVEIAKDGLAIIVNPKNPVSGLTINQVRDVYTNGATNWSQFGGPDHKIHVITREEGSGTRSAFERLVMAGSAITPRAIVQDSNGAVRQLVSDDPNSIGFISLGLVDDTVKALDLDGIHPSRDNVLNGSYSLFRPFLFVTKKPPEGPPKQFIDYVLSPEGQRILTNEGLIPRNEGENGK